MDKQVLIDKAVEDLKGKLPQHAPDHRTVLILSTKHNHVWGAGKYEVCYRENLKVPHYNSWITICSTGEFTTRALELGWCNGYKWGVEYPTNGKRPDLDGDIIINWKDKLGFGSTCKAGFLDYQFGKKDEVVSFAVTDSRYKPKEPEQQTKNTKDLSDVIFAVSDAISVAVDAGSMPAARELQKINRDLLANNHVVGIGQPELQTKPNNSWYDPEMSKERPNNFPFTGCLAEHINWGMPIKIKFLGERFFIAEKTDASIGEDNEVCGFIGDLHPIKTEREKFVVAAINAVSNGRVWQMSNQDAEALYDAGFKAPDEKSSK